jgi:hypothetical protein
VGILLKDGRMELAGTRVYNRVSCEEKNLKIGFIPKADGLTLTISKHLIDVGRSKLALWRYSL